MTRKELQTLVDNCKWTELLDNLPEGDTPLVFPSVDKIKSCKAMAYDRNSDGKSALLYYFNVDKQHLLVNINTTKR